MQVAQRLPIISAQACDMHMFPQETEYSDSSVHVHAIALPTRVGYTCGGEIRRYFDIAGGRVLDSVGNGLLKGLRNRPTLSGPPHIFDRPARRREPEFGIAKDSRNGPDCCRNWMLRCLRSLVLIGEGHSIKGSFACDRFVHS